MQQYDTTVVRRHESALATNKVLRNTYTLLSLTLLCTAVVAGISMKMGLPHPGLILTLVGYFGLLWATSATRNSGWGLLFVFLLTGFMGLTLGPLVAHYVKVIPNGHELVMTAFGGTAVIFLALSAYVLATKKDFSFLAGILTIGILVAFLAGLGAFVFNWPAVSLAISSVWILLMAGLILFETSQIIHGGQTNYIMATVTLWVAIYNMFTSLLHLLGAFSGD